MRTCSSIVLCVIAAQTGDVERRDTLVAVGAPRHAVLLRYTMSGELAAYSNSFTATQRLQRACL